MMVDLFPRCLRNYLDLIAQPNGLAQSNSKSAGPAKGHSAICSEKRIQCPPERPPTVASITRGERQRTKHQ
jgi:hypothetical protein